MSSMAYQEVSICVPVEGSEDQVVEIPFAELPAEVEDTLELLRSVLAPLHVWLDFAKAYLANGQVTPTPAVSSCKAVLKTAILIKR